MPFSISHNTRDYGRDPRKGKAESPFLLEYVISGRDLSKVHSVPSYQSSDRVLQGRRRFCQGAGVSQALEEARGGIVSNARAIVSYKSEYCFPDNEAQRDYYQVP